MKEILRVNDLIILLPGATRIINGLSIVACEKENVFIQTSEIRRRALFDTLTGLHKPDSGDVYICGELLYNKPEKQIAAFRCHHIGAVITANAFLPESPVIDSLTLPLVLSGVSEDDARERIKQLARGVITSDILYMRPGFLSPFHTATAACIRAMSMCPQFLILDDFTCQLDPREQSRIWEIISIIRPEKSLLLFMSSGTEPCEMLWTQSMIL